MIDPERRRALVPAQISYPEELPVARERERILAALARGDRSVLPEGGVLEVPTVVVRKDNVEDFKTKLAEMKAQGA